MSRRELKNLLALVAAASVLLMALGGWAWVVSESLGNEREVVAAELQTQRKERLDLLAGQLEEALDDACQELVRRFESKSDAQQAYAEQFATGIPSGISFPSPDRPSTSTPGSLDHWKILSSKSIDEAFADQLASAITQGDLAWTIDRDGRDPVASLALSVVSQLRHPELEQLLIGRAKDLNAPLKPGFRLFLFKHLPEPVPGTKRLIEAETLRINQEPPPPSNEPYEIIRLSISKGELTTYWSPEDLESLVGGFPPDIQLIAAENSGAYLYRIGRLTARPFLTIEPLSGELFGGTQRLLGTIGIASGLLLTALVVGAILFARHQHRIARTRTDLAAAVAHELRTPLAGQRLALESLSTGEMNPDKGSEYLGMALRENHRLSRLAEEFLTFSRLERGALRLDSELVDLPEIITNATGPMRELLQPSDFGIESPGKLNIRGDSEALATVVRNLVENALKYSEAPAWIRVRCFEREDHAVLEVEDHGQGIPARSLKKIFRQFHRLDDSLSRHNDGLGLGLTIVRRIIEAHHGQVAVESTPGKGSTFRITLPLEP